MHLRLQRSVRCSWTKNSKGSFTGIPFPKLLFDGNINNFSKSENKGRYDDRVTAYSISILHICLLDLRYLTGNLSSFNPFICDILYQDFLLQLLSDNPRKRTLEQGPFQTVFFSYFSPPFFLWKENSQKIVAIDKT